MKENIKIGVVGLGYVGLPVSIIFSNKYKVVGFDINKSRIDKLKIYQDETHEISARELEKNLNKNLEISNDILDLSDCNFYIITVPTPILKDKSPDLRPLKSASKSVGNLLSKGDIVVYESTVYPGCTEEVCVPVLERESGLKYNNDFYCGYSPERINPGDKKHTINKIKKVTSGSNSKIADLVDDLYKSVISAGTFKASSIKVAEAAKVIENTQRDINIAFVNELAMIFNNLDIDTKEVLNAASTKWNFLNFKPGLVGGHCIGVDPYYLANKAVKEGFKPEIILAGRKVNDRMGFFIADKIASKIKSIEGNSSQIKILILGVTFKENCPDFRNTKVVDVVIGLNKRNFKIDLYDPWVDTKLFENEYGFRVSNKLQQVKYDGIILAVSHSVFKNLNLKKLCRDSNTLIYDIKGFFKKNQITDRL